MSEKRYEVRIDVNGRPCAAAVPARLSLVDFLRDEARLTGTHVGCEHGICGACSVILDGEPVRSCLMFAWQAHGHRVTTVEGLLDADGSLSPLQDSFCETHALQCGYCTPGMLIAAHALLAENPEPTEAAIRDAIGGNLCRCTGYQQIVEAILLCAERSRGAGPLPAGSIGAFPAPPHPPNLAQGAGSLSAGSIGAFPAPPHPPNLPQGAGSLSARSIGAFPAPPHPPNLTRGDG